MGDKNTGPNHFDFTLDIREFLQLHIAFAGKSVLSTYGPAVKWSVSLRKCLTHNPQYPRGHICPGTAGHIFFYPE